MRPKRLRRRWIAALAAALLAPVRALAGPEPVAEIEPVPGMTVTLYPAHRVTLHDGSFPRTDANSPVHEHEGRLVAFVSHYHPIGHSFRRIGRPGLVFDAPLERIRILDDPDPRVGKWLESVWRAPWGALYGWYHAEEVAPCPRDLRLPHVGALVSSDEGLSWRSLGEVLRAPEGSHDCSYDNGFFAGGVGDFSVLPSPRDGQVYLFFTNYERDEPVQGVAVARYAMADLDAPAGTLELWTSEGWRPAGRAQPAPLWPQERGWRHPDPTGFWGPAVHYNRRLSAWVMLLNRTRGATRNWRQDGVYLSVGRSLADPGQWTTPVRLVEGGAWYPQVVGIAPGDGDTQAGTRARFFMAGTSDWEIVFARQSGLRRHIAHAADLTRGSLSAFLGRHGVLPTDQPVE